MWRFMTNTLIAIFFGLITGCNSNQYQQPEASKEQPIDSQIQEIDKQKNIEIQVSDGAISAQSEHDENTIVLDIDSEKMSALMNLYSFHGLQAQFPDRGFYLKYVSQSDGLEVQFGGEDASSLHVVIVSVYDGRPMPLVKSLFDVFFIDENSSKEAQKWYAVKMVESNYVLKNGGYPVGSERTFEDLSFVYVPPIHVNGPHQIAFFKKQD